MPRIVDHDQRRREIVEALYRVIRRSGVEGASVREVAAEAGWSMGAVRYYFASQEQLLTFGLQLQLEQVPQRLQQIIEQHQPGLDRALNLLRVLLPVNDEQLAEGRVWLAFLARAQIDPALAELQATAWEGELIVCRLAVCDVAGRDIPADLTRALPRALESEAQQLHIFIDGLTLAGAMSPEQINATDVEGLLQRYVDQLRSRLVDRI